MPEGGKPTEPTPAVVFAPVDGNDRWGAEAADWCTRWGLKVAAVTANPANVRIMLDSGRATYVVVARPEHVRDLIPELRVVSQDQQGPELPRQRDRSPRGVHGAD